MAARRPLVTVSGAVRELPSGDVVTVSGLLLPPVGLTDGATISVDASLGCHFRVTLAGNRTMANPTNLTDGQRILFEIKQDATGSRTLTWGTTYRFGDDLAQPVLSTGANKSDYLGFVYNSTAGKLDLIGYTRGF